MPKRIVIGWDYDHTQLNTGRLFEPIVREVARYVGKPLSAVQDVFDQVCVKDFTWAKWFQALGMDGEAVSLQDKLYAADVADRIEHFVYPGIVQVQRDLQGRYGRWLRQALVTAGDSRFQEWKFGLNRSLHPCIAEEDRYFVSINASKAVPLALYEEEGVHLIFVDDSPHWHRQVIDYDIVATHLRPQMPDTLGLREDPDDGKLWQVVRSAEEIEDAIEAAIAKEVL